MASKTSRYCRENLGLAPAASGAYIQLKCMEGFTGMYVGEIAPGGVLNVEKHLYEELIYVLHGIGATEVWSGSDDKKNNQFDTSGTAVL